MLPSSVAGGKAQSSSISGILFQGDSQFSSNFGNSSNIRGHSNMGPLLGDVNNTVLNSPGHSIGTSSLVTDANSGISAGPHLQRSASINTESYMRLPGSPMSFTSNNNSISVSSVIDASATMQQTNQDQHQGTVSVTSLSTLHMGHDQLFNVQSVPNAFVQDPNTIPHLQKRPRLDIKQEDILQQQLVHQLLQRQDSMQLQNPNPLLVLQQRLSQQQQQQQQQLLQSMPSMQRAQILQQQQLRQQLLQQQGNQPTSGMKGAYDGGVCSRRLMQYLYHQRQRPADNPIAYWRKFVAEYYSPLAKKRWCLSLYENVGHHSIGVFPQAAMDAWQCDICGSKSGRGFEATFEVLPRLNEIKFGSGVIDELLFLDLPRECRFPSGMMTLEYAKAVQESVYEQFRVVREGQLRIVFTPELKILSWEFCARRHEELLPRRLVARQVNQLLQVAHRCQSMISESGPKSNGISESDMQANSVMVVTAGRQLARSLEFQSLNDLGFSKRYVRCLQIAEVVNSMKDLMDFSRNQKVGPIDGLKNFPRTGPKVQKMQEMEIGVQGLPTNRNSTNKLLVGVHPGFNGPTNNQHMVGGLNGPTNNQNMVGGLNSPMNNQQMVGGGDLIASRQAAPALSNYQNLMTRQNSMTSTHSLQHEPSSPLSNISNQPQTPRSSSVLLGNVQQSPQLQNSHSGNGSQQNQSQPSNQALQKHMIQQLLQDVNNKKNGMTNQSPKNPVMNVAGDRMTFRNFPNVPANVENPLNGSNSYTAASNSTTPIGNFGFGQKVSDNLHISDEMVQDIVHEFTENGFFNNDLDENFSWKS